MRLSWITDLHLTDLKQCDLWVDKIGRENPSGVVLTGDLVDQGDPVPYLERLQEGLDLPLYFVLGNHDFYGSSIEQVRADVTLACQKNDLLTYLTTDSVQLGQTALIGHDGWADGRCGDYFGSDVTLSDILYIAEFKDLSKSDRLTMMQHLADQAAQTLEEKLSSTTAQDVIVAIHPPPFTEVCLYDNCMAPADWAPYFVSQAIGSVLLKVKDKKVTVLAGHAHHYAAHQITPHLLATTGSTGLQPPLTLK